MAQYGSDRTRHMNFARTEVINTDIGSKKKKILNNDKYGEDKIFWDCIRATQRSGSLQSYHRSGSTSVNTVTGLKGGRQRNRFRFPTSAKTLPVQQDPPSLLSKHVQGSSGRGVNLTIHFHLVPRAEKDWSCFSVPPIWRHSVVLISAYSKLRIHASLTAWLLKCKMKDQKDSWREVLTSFCLSSKL